MHPLKRSVHISGLGSNQNLLNSQQKQAFRLFQDGIQLLPDFEANEDYRYIKRGNDCVLINFLVANNWDFVKSKEMLRKALRWRTQRRAALLQCTNNNLIRVPGVDRYGRPLMVFELSSFRPIDSIIDCLAYNMELCKRIAMLAGKGADKMMLFMKIYGQTSSYHEFNLRARLRARGLVKEISRILSKVFPESVGSWVIFNSPTYFGSFSKLIDPKTSSKVFFVNGDISDGSQNDTLMKKLIGDNWKEYCGTNENLDAGANNEANNEAYKKMVSDINEAYVAKFGSYEASDDCETPKLSVGGIEVLEYNSEKWRTLRNSYEIDHGFLAKFQWEKLKGRKVLIGGKEVRVYEAESVDGKYLVKEVTVELHHWLLDNTMSYFDHFCRTHHFIENSQVVETVVSAGELLRRSSLQTPPLQIENDSSLFRILSHFRDSACGKVFVVLKMSKASTFRIPTSSRPQVSCLTVSSTRKTNDFLRLGGTVDKLQVLQQDLKWLESVGVIDFQIPQIVDGIGLITFPTNLTSNPQAARKYCEDYQDLVTRCIKSLEDVPQPLEGGGEYKVDDDGGGGRGGGGGEEEEVLQGGGELNPLHSFVALLVAVLMIWLIMIRLV